MPSATFNQGRYRVQSTLGQGGMGAVYLAKDTRSGSLVAIKENLDPTPGAGQQFEFEARILMKLSHPCLPRVFDYFTEPSGRQYLVMEYIAGDDLQAVLDKNGSPSESEVVTWTREICGALAYMHSRTPDPVVHRDIKPANIKLTAIGQAKLVDFGIAKVLRPGQKTVFAARAATPGYSPREQYGTGTDVRSDIYALGATMYHLLTGQVPPESISITPAKPLISPRRLNPALSQQVEQVILKAMAADPAQRFQTAVEMDQALALSPTPPRVCPRCGVSNRTSASFCSRCGSPFTGLPSPAGSGIPCPNCGVLNRAKARMCASCGQPLAGKRAVPAPAPMIRGIPSPPRASEHRIAAWSLLGLAVLSLLVFLWWPISRLVGGGLVAAGVVAVALAVVAARDILDLGTGYKYALPIYLSFLMGSQHRGRRLGIVAACMLAFLLIGQAWTILPLLPVAMTVYVVSILTSQEAVTACGGHYGRPAGATLLGWGLVLSGVGALPGIGLLVPQPWARRGAMIALIVLAVLGGLALIAVAIWGLAAPAGTTPLAHEVEFSSLGGAPVRVYSLAAICYALALLSGSLISIWYLRRAGPLVVATPTSVQRELTAAAWILVGIGLFLLMAPYTIWPAGRWGLLPRGVVVLPGLLCLAAARDLSQWFQAWSRYPSPIVGALFGSVRRGRILGIVGAVLAAAIFLGMAWLVMPLALAFVAFYAIRILTNRAVASRCAAYVSIPPGAALVAWLLIPTAIGTLPGIAMLTPKRWARRAGVIVLACLLATGLLLAVCAGVRGMGVPADSSYLSEMSTLPFIGLPVRANALTVGVYGLELALGCALAIRYLQSRSLRIFYGA